MADDKKPNPKTKRGSIIKPRPRVGYAAAIAIALGFAVIATPIVMGQDVLGSLGGFETTPGKSAPMTVRIPMFRGYDPTDEPFVLKGGSIVVTAGDHVDAKTAARIDAVRSDQPHGAGAWLGYFIALFLLAMLFTAQLRRSHLGKLYRTMCVTLGLMLGVAFAVKLLLMFTSISSLIVPVGAAALVTALVVDLSSGLAVGLTASVLIGFLVPFDIGGIAVLAVQGLATVLVLGDPHKTKRGKRHVVLAGAFGGVAAASAYLVLYYLTLKQAPTTELSSPLSSAWLAAAAGGLLSGFVAIAVQPLYQYLLGELTRNKLVELEDLSNPLLKQIAAKSPGTWQHSLAMANMSEIAANAIGANGRLVRVGAYYHDLGKSLQAKYFIENLAPGEKSPHDRLAPEVSCDAIFAHVTEGVRVGRENGLPERIIDFMHMHHGDGRLEYFWAKCQEEGNPKGLTEEDFRYPGLRPQTRETAILAICDAVEAASRTLKQPDERSIRQLVTRIVYGKLHQGQLDYSGLSVADLRKITDSLTETIKHAFHGRIEYPWQREERERKEAEARGETTAPESPAGKDVATARAIPRSRTQRLIEELRLDSLDAPRPYWRNTPLGVGTGTKDGNGAARDGDPEVIANAATERVATGENDNRPGTVTDTVLLQRSSPAESPAEDAGSSGHIPLQADAAASSSAQIPQQTAAVASSPTLTPQPVEPRPSNGASAPAVAQPAQAQERAATPVPAARPATPVPAPRPATPDPVVQGAAGAVAAAASVGRSRPRPKVTQPYAPRGDTPVPAAAPDAGDFAATPGTNPGVGEVRAPSASQNIIVGAAEDLGVTEEAVAAPAPEPEAVSAPEPEAVSAPAPAPAPVSAPALAPEPAREAAGAADADGMATVTQPLSPTLPPREQAGDAPAEATDDPQESPPMGQVRAAAQQDVEVWQTALRATDEEQAVDDNGVTNVREVPKGRRMTPSERRAKKRQPPPPPGSSKRAKSTTIQLMGDDAASRDEERETVARAETDNPELNPGVMVIGPPPATLKKPRRETEANDDFDDAPTLNPARRKR